MMDLSSNINYNDIPLSIVNTEVSSDLARDIEKPYTLLQFIEFISYKTDYTNISNFYNLYLNKWYQQTNSKESGIDELVVSSYIEFIQQLSTNYSTETERHFLSNVDFTNPYDLDVAISFISRKIKEIAIYYSAKRENIKLETSRKKLKSSNKGIAITIREKIIEFLQNRLSKKEAYSVEDISEKVNVHIDELYDTNSNYLNKKPNSEIIDNKDRDYGLDIFLMSNTDIVGRVFAGLGQTERDLNEVDAVFTNKQELTKKFIGADFYYLSATPVISRQQGGSIQTKFNIRYNRDVILNRARIIATLPPDGTLPPITLPPDFTLPPGFTLPPLPTLPPNTTLPDLAQSNCYVIKGPQVVKYIQSGAYSGTFTSTGAWTGTGPKPTISTKLVTENNTLGICSPLIIENYYTRLKSDYTDQTQYNPYSLVRSSVTPINLEPIGTCITDGECTRLPEQPTLPPEPTLPPPPSTPDLPSDPNDPGDGGGGGGRKTFKCSRSGRCYDTWSQDGYDSLETCERFCNPSKQYRCNGGLCNESNIGGAGSYPTKALCEAACGLPEDPEDPSIDPPVYPPDEPGPEPEPDPRDETGEGCRVRTCAHSPYVGPDTLNWTIVFDKSFTIGAGDCRTNSKQFNKGTKIPVQFTGTFYAYCSSHEHYLTTNITGYNNVRIRNGQRLAFVFREDTCTSSWKPGGDYFYRDFFVVKHKDPVSGNWDPLTCDKSFTFYINKGKSVSITGLLLDGGLPKTEIPECCGTPTTQPYYPPNVTPITTSPTQEEEVYEEGTEEGTEEDGGGDTGGGGTGGGGTGGGGTGGGGGGGGGEDDGTREEKKWVCDQATGKCIRDVPTASNPGYDDEDECNNNCEGLKYYYCDDKCEGRDVRDENNIYVWLTKDACLEACGLKPTTTQGVVEVESDCPECGEEPDPPLTEEPETEDDYEEPEPPPPVSPIDDDYEEPEPPPTTRSQEGYQCVLYSQDANGLPVINDCAKVGGKSQFPYNPSKLLYDDYDTCYEDKENACSFATTTPGPSTTPGLVRYVCEGFATVANPSSGKDPCVPVGPDASYYEYGYTTVEECRKMCDPNRTPNPGNTFTCSDYEGSQGDNDCIEVKKETVHVDNRYNTLEICRNACNDRYDYKSYKCQYETCFEHVDGEYASKSDCEAECLGYGFEEDYGEPPSPPRTTESQRYTCVPGSIAKKCEQNDDGEWSSKEECERYCNTGATPEPTPPPPPPDPYDTTEDYDYEEEVEEDPLADCPVCPPGSARERGITKNIEPPVRPPPDDGPDQF